MEIIGNRRKIIILNCSQLFLSHPMGRNQFSNDVITFIIFLQNLMTTHLIFFQVCDYLSAQHSLCKNPMVTCPEFDLLAHHKCPDPRPKQSAPWNFTSRYAKFNQKVAKCPLGRIFCQMSFGTNSFAKKQPQEVKHNHNCPNSRPKQCSLEFYFKV